MIKNDLKKARNHCQPQLAHNPRQCNLKISFSQLRSGSSRKFHYVNEPSRKFYSHWSHELLPQLVMLEKSFDCVLIINTVPKTFVNVMTADLEGFRRLSHLLKRWRKQTIENVANHKNKINISLRQIIISSWFITFEPFFNNGKSFIPFSPFIHQRAQRRRKVWEWHQSEN